MTREQFDSLKDGDKVTLKNGVLRVVMISTLHKSGRRVWAMNASGKGAAIPINTHTENPDGFSHYSQWSVLPL